MHGFDPGLGYKKMVEGIFMMPLDSFDFGGMLRRDVQEPEFRVLEGVDRAVAAEGWRVMSAQSMLYGNFEYRNRRHEHIIRARYDFRPDLRRNEVWL